KSFPAPPPEPAEARNLRFSTLSASAIALATMLPVSCATIATVEPANNMNQTQAEEQTEAYIINSGEAFPVSIELSSVTDRAFPSCEGEPGDENHTVQVRHSFWVDGASEDKNEELAESLHAFWEAGNWEIIRDARPEKILIEAKNRENQFRMKLVVSQDGQIGRASCRERV